jgi:hypothetical protein
LSIRALAAKHGVHRRAVRHALASPVPPLKRTPTSRPAPKLGAFGELIDEWLIAADVLTRGLRPSDSGGLSSRPDSR